MSFDTTKTLDELEGVVWGAPTFNSHLVTTCHRLRTKPVQDFTIEDLRIMILQQFSLEYLIPLALVRLEDNPWAEGNYYEGDLLYSVLRLGAPFWNAHPDWKKRIDGIVLKIAELPVPILSEEILASVSRYRREREF